jgi:hypothetical protein
LHVTILARVVGSFVLEAREAVDPPLSLSSELSQVPAKGDGARASVPRRRRQLLFLGLQRRWGLELRSSLGRRKRWHGAYGSGQLSVAPVALISWAAGFARKPWR